MAFQQNADGSVGIVQTFDDGSGDSGATNALPSSPPSPSPGVVESIAAQGGFPILIDDSGSSQVSPVSGPQPVLMPVPQAPASQAPASQAPPSSGGGGITVGGPKPPEAAPAIAPVRKATAMPVSRDGGIETPAVGPTRSKLLIAIPVAMLIFFIVLIVLDNNEEKKRA